MPEPLDMFLDVAHKNDVDDIILESPIVQKGLDTLEGYGKDLESIIKNIGKRPPKRPSGPTPDYRESAFVKTGKETTLYNVTNAEREVPVVEKVSHFFKKTSYRVRGFLVAADYKSDNTKYSVYAGEKVGIGYRVEQGSTSSGFSALYNVGNKKATLSYTSTSNRNSYDVSVYNQSERVGATVSYRGNSGLHSKVSIDNESASINVGYNKQSQNCTTKLSAYVTSGKNYSNPLVGVTGRITF